MIRFPVAKLKIDGGSVTGLNRDLNFGDYGDAYFGSFISMDFILTVEISNVTFRDNIYPDL